MRAGWAAKMSKTMELFRSEEMQLMQVATDMVDSPFLFLYLPY